MTTRLRRVCIDCKGEQLVGDNGQMRRKMVDGVVRTRCRPCHAAMLQATGGPKPPPVTTPRDRNDIDCVMVDRLMGGRTKGSNIAERLEATARLFGLYRLPAGLVAERLGVTTRTAQRYKAELRASGRLAA